MWFWLMACGPSDEAFVARYTEDWCAVVMACSDPAVLAFDGIETVEDCEAIVGSQVEVEAASCSYDPKAARSCLSALHELGCDGSQAPVEPSTCSVVFLECTEGGENASGS